MRELVVVVLTVAAVALLAWLLGRTPALDHGSEDAPSSSGDTGVSVMVAGTWVKPVEAEFVVGNGLRITNSNKIRFPPFPVDCEVDRLGVMQNGEVILEGTVDAPPIPAGHTLSFRPGALVVETSAQMPSD